MTRARTWLLVAPLVLASSELAHALLNRLVVDDDRTAELVGAGGVSLTGVLAIAGALAIAGVAALALGGPSRRSLQLSAWPFASLPLAAFVLQEHVELTLARGHWATPVLEPAFLLGLALQLPLAAGAYAIARILSRVAERIAARRHCRRVPAVRLWRAARWSLAETRLRPFLAFDDGAPPRGPPATA